MHAELIEQLRCPAPHEESWLVAMATRTEDRDLLEGMLGCPVCHAQYPITEGVVRFAPPLVAATDSAATGEAAAGTREEEAMRLAALLDLTDARAVALLAGTWGRLASDVRTIAPGVLLLLDPPPGVALGGGVSAMDAAAAIPVAPATLAAAALDAAHCGAESLAAAVRALRPGGRLLAPASAPLPDGVRELARDGEAWVAAREADAGPVIALRRRG